MSKNLEIKEHYLWQIKGDQGNENYCLFFGEYLFFVQGVKFF